MRASTVFILALALLIGLGVAAVAKSAGLFKEKEKAPPAAPIPGPRILAAKVNLYEDITTTADLVYVRELRPDEEAKLKAKFGDSWPEKVMQPLPTAAHLRVARRNIPADSILMRDDFGDATLPDKLSAQLEPNTRAVNVSVPKDKAAGGVMRVGEYVDLFLTTKVSSGGGPEELRTACIARGCKIVMKRNVLWAMMASDPDDKPLHFTLQANAYRAALIEYAQTLGQLSLFPVTAPPKTNGTFSDPSSKEYANEDQRIDEILRGGRTIGTDDLMRIFQITPAPLRQRVPPLRVQHLAGVAPAGETVLPGASAPPAPVEPTAPAAPPVTTDPNSSSRSGGGEGGEVQQAAYTFRLPSASGEGSGCKSCDEKKKAEEEAKKFKTIRSAP
jgi:Flp pilus assembly protein CpaB